METKEINQVDFLTYESAMQDHRLRFANFLKPFFSEQDPKIILLFWINFSYLGVGMTEPVEHWIRRAGENCKKMGHLKLGDQLRKHAIHEADHHLMMIEDAKKLIAIWNKKYSPSLEVNDLLARPFRDCVLAYRDLHEFHIEGKTPYCQIAIEYEIENLSATYGKEIMNYTYKILGEEIMHCLSFVDEHVRIDVAHTLYNRKAISEFLETNPHTVKDLSATGCNSLDIYGSFLAECYNLAKNSAS